MAETPISEGGQPQAPMSCAGETADGSRCRAPEELLQVDPEDGETRWCFAHAPWLEQERLLAQRRGGLRSAARARRFRFLDQDQLGLLETPTDAKRWSQVIARAVATGELSATAGTAALKALDAFLRAYEMLEVLERLAVVEGLMQKADEEREAVRGTRVTRPTKVYPAPLAMTKGAR